MSNTNEKYPQSDGWPLGWTDEMEKEYQRKQSMMLTANCPLCKLLLGYGHLVPYKGGYAHRRCVLQTNNKI